MKINAMYIRNALTICVLYSTTCAFGQIEGQKRCLDPKYHEMCFYSTKSIFEDYIYLKSRPFSRDMQELKFVLNLKKNTLYLFNLCEGSSARVNIKLYDPEDEVNPIASTYDAEKNTFNQLLSFYSSSNGTYLISVSFEHSKLNCAVVVCGLIRKNIEEYISIPKEPMSEPAE